MKRILKKHLLLWLVPIKEGYRGNAGFIIEKPERVLECFKKPSQFVVLNMNVAIFSAINDASLLGVEREVIGDIIDIPYTQVKQLTFFVRTKIGNVVN